MSFAARAYGAKVVRAVSMVSGVSVGDIRGPSQATDLVYTRAAVIRIMRERGGATPFACGKAIGGRDCSTVRSHVRHFGRERVIILKNRAAQWMALEERA